MYSKFRKMNSSGFTLIEIIASIAILGMVIAVFLPIFPQIVAWTNNNDHELVSSNLLGKIAYDINNNETIIDYIDGRPIPSCPSENFSIPVSSLGSTSSYEINGVTYSVKLAICQSNEEQTTGIYRTNIRIFSPQDKQISESYTYITNINGDSSE